MRYFLLYLILFVELLNAQINFMHEFNLYKLNLGDTLKSLQLFDFEGEGEEEIIANYFSEQDNLLCVVRYSSEGVFINQRQFTFENNEFYLSSTIFKKENKNYLVSASSKVVALPDTLDSNFSPPTIAKRSNNFLILKFYDYDSLKLVDTSVNYIGNYKKAGPLYHTNLWISKFNFMKLVELNDANNIIIGIEINHFINNFNSQEKNDYTSQLYKFTLDNNIFSVPTVYSTCGNDIYINSQNELITTGYFKELKISLGSIQSTNQYILLFDEEMNQILDKQLYFTGFHSRSGLSESYTSFTEKYGGFYNNFPYKSNLNPLYYYQGRDKNNKNWDGGNIFSYSDDHQSINYIELGAFSPNQLEKTHTNLFLSDSTFSLLYYTTEESITTLWLRRIEDGTLLYSNSSFLPFSILETSRGLQLFFKEEPYGCAVYRLQEQLTSIEESKIQNIISLAQNYPNPFNPITNIQYQIPDNSNIRLVIYDVLGKEVKTIVNEFQKSGKYKVQFNGKNLSSGIYFYRLFIGNNTLTKKLILLK